MQILLQKEKSIIFQMFLFHLTLFISITQISQDILGKSISKCFYFIPLLNINLKYILRVV